MTLPERPCLRTELYEAMVRGRMVVLDPRQRRLVELQPELADLWPLLDGSRTTSDLADRWTYAAQADAAEASVVVEAVVGQLIQAGLVQPNED